MLLPSSYKVRGSNPGQLVRAFLCGVCMFCTCLRGFSPTIQTYAFRLIGVSKLFVAVSVNGSLSPFTSRCNIGSSIEPVWICLNKFSDTL